MADTPTGETVVKEAPSNNANPTAAPQANAVDNAEVERLRKEAEQKEIRIRQLENQEKTRKEQEEAAKQKQLEEQNEWKQIAEQNAAKLEALQKEREEADTKAAQETAENEVFGEFSDDVVELAKEAGIRLGETSDEAKEKLRGTLSKLSGKVSGTPKPNNGNQPKQPAMTREQLLAEHAKNPTPALMDEAIAQLAWIQHHTQRPE